MGVTEEGGVGQTKYDVVIGSRSTRVSGSRLVNGCCNGVSGYVWLLRSRNRMAIARYMSH
jgi:hypothetical protein